MKKFLSKKAYKIIRAIDIVLIAYILVNVIYYFFIENSIPIAEEEEFAIQNIIDTENSSNVLGNEVQEENILQEEEENQNEEFVNEENEEVEHIDEQYKGYTTCAKLIIPEINLETYILDNYQEWKMDICPVKYYGPEPNEIGNFCIVGHNYKKENMFSELINLHLGDELYLIDNKNGKYRYTIYDMYRVQPTNLECLNQNTGKKRVVTLISCVNYSNLRIIIKAVEE